MSDIARWAYKNVATVWPLIPNTRDDYGEPYEIACTWVGGGEQMINNDGREFVSKMKFYHEDERVKYGDLIIKGVSTKINSADRIQSHTEYDMAMFNTNPDYLTVT